MPVALAVVGAWIVLAALPASHGAVAFALMWAAMTVAMMVPTVLRPLQRAAAGSTPRGLAFVAGFVVVWLVAGVPAYLLMNAAVWTPAWIAIIWMAAGGYQLTPWMLRNMTACHTVPFDGRPLAYGARQGVRCVASCWPVMVAVMVTAMAIPNAVLSLAVLAAVTVVICWEKDPRTNARMVAALGIALLLVGAAGFVTLGGGSGGSHHSMGSSTS